MEEPDGEPGLRFAAAYSELEEELDWRALGREYGEGDASGFFDAAERENLREVGLRFAGDLEELRPSGRSVYLGAGVFELAPLLCEMLVLGRQVRAFTLPGGEADELNRALSAVRARLGFALPRYETRAPDPDGVAPCDHGWMVSALTDPASFPALHDELYGRRGGELATGRGDPGRERARARRLVARLLDCLEPPCRLTTTDEELELVAEVCAERRLALEVPRTARLSAIVGDPVRACRLVRAAAGAERASAGSAARPRRPSGRRARRRRR